MMQTSTSKLLAGAALVALSATALLAPLQALAGNTQSKGHAVKCYWVLVSSNPATGSNVYTQVCRKVGV